MTNLSLIPSLTHYSCVLILTNMVHACPSLFHYNRAFLFFIYLFSFPIINSLKVASFIFIIFIFNIFHYMDFSYEWTIFSVFFPHTFINWWDSQWTGIHIQCFSKLIIIKAYSLPHECDQKKKRVDFIFVYCHDGNLKFLDGDTKYFRPPSLPNKTCIS